MTKHDADLRAAMAVQSRLRGNSYQQIAIELGYAGKQGAYEAVSRGIRNFARESAEEVRDLEVARLDALMHAYWTKALDGNLPAAEYVLKVMLRRAALLGLDAPRKVDITAMVRQVALEHGLDPDEAIRHAEAIVKAAGA